MPIDDAWEEDKDIVDSWNNVYKSVVEKTKIKTEEKERVNHPDHYNQGGIECIDAIESATIGLEGVEAFYTGNIIKYIWRWKYKNGIEDLKKIQFYLNRLIGYLERK